MTDDFRDRLYAAYATTHNPGTGESSLLSFRRDLAPHLPSDKSLPVVDLGCGQGQLVRHLLAEGYLNAAGIDISPEQVELAHHAGVDRVRLGDYREGLGQLALGAVTATDFFEHLTRSEGLEALDRVHEALLPGGVLIARVPNSVSPFGGHIRYGDITHETSFTARSLRQLGAAANFHKVDVFPCPPPVHGLKSMARGAVWKLASAAMKVALAAETGAVRGHLVTQNIVAVFRKA